MKINKRTVLASIMIMVLMFTIMPLNNVAEASEKISLSKETLTMYVGGSYTLKVKGTQKKVKWTSSKKKIASVDTTGKITAKKAGNTKITAKIGKKQLSCAVTVYKPCISRTSLTLMQDKTYTLKLKGTSAVSWKSSNTSVATVGKAGKVTAKKVGTATITATGKNKKKYKCKLTVTHVHDYELQYTKDATCTEPGYDLYVCSCGKNYTEEIEANGHFYDEKEIKELTCTSEGVIKYTCEDCGYSYEETIAPTGHVYDDGEITREPTCERKGIKVISCENCNSHKIEYIDKLGHSYTEAEIVEEPTCEEEGLQEQTCLNCLETLETEIPALGHDYEFVKVVDSTCEDEGCSLYRCTRCGEEEERDMQEVKEHTFDSGEITEEPTCIEEGEKTYTCTVCGYTKTESIAKIEHDYELSDDSSESTCTESGENIYRCTMCDDEYVDKIVPLGHDYTTTVVAPTCEEEGYTLHTCSRCEDEYKDNIVEMIPHSYDEGVISEEPSCTEAGVKVFTCSLCGGEKEEEIAALGHDYVKKNVQATASTSGYAEYTCSQCGDSYKDYSESTEPKLLYDWHYTLYDSESLINIDEFKNETITTTGINLPGKFTIDGKEYKTTIGYGSNAKTKEMFGESNKQNIRSVELSGVILYNADSLFSGMTNLSTVQLKDVECAEEASLTEMFKDCTSLVTMDLSGVNIELAGSLFGTFKGCTSLETVLFPCDNVSDSITNVGSMFEDCTSLTTLYNCESFTLENVKYAGGMFANCKKLTHNDFSFIGGDEVITTIKMFNNCESLTTVYLPNITYSEDAVEGNISWMEVCCADNMFTNCTKLQEIYVNSVMCDQLSEIGTDSILVNTPGYFMLTDE